MSRSGVVAKDNLAFGASRFQHFMRVNCLRIGNDGMNLWVDHTASQVIRDEGMLPASQSV